MFTENEEHNARPKVIIEKKKPYKPRVKDIFVKPQTKKQKGKPIKG